MDARSQSSTKSLTTLAMAKMDPARALQRFPLTPPKLVDRRTRVEDAIVLCHVGVAQVTRDEWSLAVDGLVDRPAMLRFDDLARYPNLELASVHQCCGSPFTPSSQRAGSPT